MTALAIGAASAAAFPTIAWAGSASLESRQTAAGQGVTVLVFGADAGERNQLEARPDGGAIRVVDSRPIRAGAGCGATSDPNTVRCPLLPYTLLLGADVELGDRTDSAILDRALGVGTVVRGGAGDDDIHASGLLAGEAGLDVLTGGPGADTLRGATGNDLLFGGPGADAMEPGPGRDVVQAGAGNDRIPARDGAFDRISCGGGRDTLRLDALDFPGRTCLRSSLRRRGRALALPLEATLSLNDRLRLEVGCPADAARACRGTVSARLGRQVVGHRRFRIRRGDRETSAVRPRAGQLRRMRRSKRFGVYTGRFTITVRSRVRGGRARTISQRIALTIEGPL